MREVTQSTAGPEPLHAGRAAAAYAAARLYYEDELSQAAIAERLEVSRSTVSRLLADAREQGIVRIEIHPPIPESRLGDELADALGLRRVVAVGHGHSAGSRMAMVDAARHELSRLALKPGDVLVLGWGRQCWAVANAPLPPLPGVRIVPAVGGMAETEQPFQGNEIVRRAAESSGASPHFLHAPAVPGKGLRGALLRDEAIKAVVSLWDDITAAVLGIGVPPGQPGSYSPAHVKAGDAPPMLDAAGDVLTRFFDIDGAPVTYPAERRLLAVTREQLARAGTVIGLAAGENKHRAMVGAARAGVIDVLVTDIPNAAAALELAGATT